MVAPPLPVLLILPSLDDAAVGTHIYSFLPPLCSGVTYLKTLLAQDIFSVRIILLRAIVRLDFTGETILEES